MVPADTTKRLRCEDFVSGWSGSGVRARAAIGAPSAASRFEQLGAEKLQTASRLAIAQAFIEGFNTMWESGADA